MKVTVSRIQRVALVAALCVAGTFRSGAVEPGLPSKTAVSTAAARAIGAKHPDPARRNPDYLAIAFLGPEERAILPEWHLELLDLDYAAAFARFPAQGNVQTQMLRTKAFDAAILSAVSDGATQVVVLGAGFDSRAYRFETRLAAARVFEVDYGPTQERKRERVRRTLGRLPANVTFVPIDFTKDDLGRTLRAAGYSESARTFFLWEGVVVYLAETAVKDTMHFVRDHAAAGSRLAFDYILETNQNLNNPRSRYAEWGEPWLFGFPATGAAAFVRAQGLEIVSDSVGEPNFCVARVTGAR